MDINSSDVNEDEGDVPKKHGTSLPLLYLHFWSPDISPSCEYTLCIYFKVHTKLVITKTRK